MRRTMAVINRRDGDGRGWTKWTGWTKRFMQFVKPLPFVDAVEKIGSRSPIGSAMLSSEWSDLPVALRERAFFSSQVESVRFLQRGRDGLVDFLQGAKVVLPSGETALATGSRAQFVEQMRA